MAKLTITDLIEGTVTLEMNATCAFAAWSEVFDRLTYTMSMVIPTADRKPESLIASLMQVLLQNWDESGSVTVEYVGIGQTTRVQFLVDATENMCGKVHDVNIPDDASSLMPPA